MFLTEYNEELHISNEKQLSYNEGHAEGREESRILLNKLIEKMIACGRLEDLERSTKDPEYQEQLLKEFGL